MINYRLILLSVVAMYQVSKPEVNTRNRRPKGSVSYALLLLLNENSEVLLLRRKGVSFGDGLYSLPGGKIESGETALEAVKREAKEELDINVEQLKLVHVVNRQGTETEFYVFVFKPDVWQGVPHNNESDKCDDMRWFSLDMLPQELIPAHRQAIECSQNKITYSEHGWNPISI